MALRDAVFSFRDQGKARPGIINNLLAPAKYGGARSGETRL